MRGLCVSVGLVLGGVLPVGNAAPATPSWQLMPDWRCLSPIATCSSFTPSGGTKARPQDWKEPLQFQGDGRLDVAPGQLVLKAPDGGFLHITGPGTFYLLGGQLLPLATVDVLYKHHSGGESPPAGRTQLLVPPLVAGPDGTIIDMVMTRRGGLALQVLEGRACVSWMDQQKGPRECLSDGEGLVVDADAPESRVWYKLEPDDARAHLKQLRQSARSPESRAVPGTPAEAHERFLSALPTLAPAQVQAQAVALVNSQRDPLLTPRALYFAWLSLTIGATPSERDTLAGLLLEHFPDSVWTSTLKAQSSGTAANSPGPSSSSHDRVNAP